MEIGENLNIMLLVVRKLIYSRISRVMLSYYWDYSNQFQFGDFINFYIRGVKTL